MIIYFVIVLSLAALAVDFYIYHRSVRRHWGRWGKIAYIVLSVLVDCAVLAAILAFRLGARPPMFLILCVTGVFFLNLVPKVAYTVLSLLDYPVRWAGRKRFRLFGIIGTLVAVYVFGLVAWGLTRGRSDIRVTRVELASDRLPESFDGLRIVEFADLHMGNLVNRDRYMRRIVDTINALNPDIVVQCGDIVNIESGEMDERAMQILGGIRSRYGVYSVLGNHDLTFYIRDTVRVSPAASMIGLYAKQAALGWHLLVNRTEYIHNGTDSIAIAGVNFPAGDASHNGLQETFAGADIKACYAGVPDSTYMIMLSHTPALWDEILECGQADLTLSGHVHAMQVKLGWGRHVWSPARKMYTRWSGLYEQDGRYLYVNDGVGYVMYPMRINARPEITLITLRSR